MICHNLCTRAKQLGVNGIYYGDAQKCINNPGKIYDWLNVAYPKILEAEKKHNPAYVSNADYETSRKRVEYEDTAQLRQDSVKIARELYGALHDSYEGGWRSIAQNLWDNKDNSVTKGILKQISPSNVAFVVQTYKKNYKTSLAEDINSEWIGLSVKDIKEQLCAKLVTQAKKLRIAINTAYQNITDIKKLAAWMDNVSKAIITAMDGYSSVLPSDNTKEIVTERPGGGKIKTITNGNMFVEAGITKVVEEYDKSGNKIQSTIYYKDGKETLEVYGKNIKTGKTELKEVKLLKHGSVKKPQNTGITEPVKMDLKVPSNASEEARKFADALEHNKKTLMQLMNIDNDTYNKLALLAMAIAEQETNFDNMPYDSLGCYKPILSVPDTLGGNINDGVFGGEYSFGMTQIKLGLWLNPEKEPEIYKLFTEKLDITKGRDISGNIDKCAMATMAILATIYNRIQSQTVQNSIEAANGRIVSNEGWEMNHRTGILEKTYNTKSYVNKVTDEDAICYYWNNGGAAIRRGTADPAGNRYTNNVRKYIKKYRIEENPADREKAIIASKIKKQLNSKKQSNNSSFTPMDNNGPMGSIIFMPMMYSNKPVNKTEEMIILIEGLRKNTKIYPKSKRALIEAVEKKELAFEFGLSAEEVASLTQSDVDKLLKNLRELKQKIESSSNVKFSDGISAEEARVLGNKFKADIRRSEYNFKREYLNSKSKLVKLSSDNKNAVKLNNNTMQFSAYSVRRGFVGNIPDRGVNTSGTSAASAALAEHARKVSANKTQQAIAQGKQPGGYCLDGFRDAMYAAGIKNFSEFVGAPKRAAEFFENHKDMFEEVKWIDLGNGGGRQINSTDLPKLPAGYIVIWVPGSDEKFTNQKGHISITNGNGQAYADETDNLDWGGYSGSAGSGKGEHGHFRVFRLTNKWTVGPDGKLVFNG
jgi:hypothetical protein